MVVVQSPGLDSDSTIAAVNLYVGIGYIVQASACRRGDDTLMGSPSQNPSGRRSLGVLHARDCS